MIGRKADHEELLRKYQRNQHFRSLQLAVEKIEKKNSETDGKNQNKPVRLCYMQKNRLSNRY